MCLAQVRLAEESEGAEPIMSDVARIESTEEGLIVTDLMGESRRVAAKIKAIDFMESTVVVERRKE